MKGIIKYFSITGAILFMIALSGCYYMEDRGNSDDPESGNYIEDYTVPVPGDEGKILAQVIDDAVNLSWSAAVDDITPQAELVYAVYQSDSDNISTVDDCEQNGILLEDYMANLTSVNLLDLEYLKTYYFNVVVSDLDGNKQIYAIKYYYISDTTAPVPGSSGTITAESVTYTSFTLNWTAATDNTTAQADLLYAVYQSASNNISELMTCENNGTIILDYTADITTLDVTDLSAGATYYFNVIVKDDNGNKACYTYKQQATTIDDEVPAPGNSGTISSSDAGNSLILGWTAATDNLTLPEDLLYAVYISESNTLTSESTCISTGTLVQDYTPNLTTKTVSGLKATTLYYFNVLVKDTAGNIAIYQMGSDTTGIVDENAPDAGSGTITTSSVLQNSLVLNWTKASDALTVQNQLKYAVYRSSTNNIDNVYGCETYGTLVQNYTTDIATCTVTGLTTGVSSGTTYYFNVLVKDAAGNKEYYLMRSATTLAAVLPTVTTTSVTGIGGGTKGCNNVMSGGNVTNSGGLTVSASGVCWDDTDTTPDLGDSYTINGSGTGSYISNLYPLVPGTTYYVRAYATTAKGTGYGSMLTFTTGSSRQLGDTGQAGGRIFYKFFNKFTGTTYYYEAYPSNRTAVAWATSTHATGATATAVGTGDDNTDTIYAELGASAPAAYNCYKLSYGGYTDWYLPSLNEVDEMHDNLAIYGIGSFGTGALWTSSEISSKNAYSYNFSSGRSVDTLKTVTLVFRPYRVFTN